MKMNLTGAIEILKLHKHTTDKFKHSVGDQYVSDAIDTVVAELEKELPVGFRCPCCGSERIYPTLAVHCNTCAVTSEI